MALATSCNKVWLVLVAAAAVMLTWGASPAAAVTQEASDMGHTLKQQQATLQLKACYEDVLALQQSVPSLTSEIRPLMLSTAMISREKNTVWHLRCNGSTHRRQSHSWPVPFRGQHIKLVPTAADDLQQMQRLCTKKIPGLSIVIGRIAPLKHFGHRMLTDLPALHALKIFLQEHGIDNSKITVYFLDDLGSPAWGAANFKRILESLGYASYHVQASSASVMCFHQAILMPVTFYPKWLTVAGKPVNMWSAPEQLYDVDPFHIRMVGDIRAAFGLPHRLPFVDASNVQIVLASRDKDTRKRAGFRMARILTDEAELYQALKALPNVTVTQIDLGTISMDMVLHLLDRTSLFMGYHGAAFDNLVFLPRGAYILEILPKGTTHSPLYPSLAARTAKGFARYVNSESWRQSCRRRQDGQEVIVKECLDHHADLQMNVGEVMKLVRAILHTQQAAMTRYPFDDNV